MRNGVFLMAKTTIPTAPRSLSRVLRSCRDAIWTYTARRSWWATNAKGYPSTLLFRRCLSFNSESGLGSLGRGSVMVGIRVNHGGDLRTIIGGLKLSFTSLDNAAKSDRLSSLY